LRQIIAALALALALAACGFTPYGDVGRDMISGKGAQAYDEGLKNIEWGLCEAASIGSIKRRYGTSAARAKQYSDFCPATAIPDLFEGVTLEQLEQPP